MKYILLAILFQASLLQASEIRMYQGKNLVGSAPATMGFVTKKPENIIWIRSRITPNAELFECLTSRQDLARYFKDPQMATLSYHDLFEKISKLGPIFHCELQGKPFNIEYQKQEVLYYLGSLVGSD